VTAAELAVNVDAATAVCFGTGGLVLAAGRLGELVGLGVGLGVAVGLGVGLGVEVAGARVDTGAGGSELTTTAGDTGAELPGVVPLGEATPASKDPDGWPGVAPSRWVVVQAPHPMEISAVARNDALRRRGRDREESRRGAGT